MTDKDLDGLTTRLKKDRAYTGEKPAHEGMRGFVCPRANAYGGRDGIISPGIAVQHGLVPRGMRRVSVGEISRSADRALAAGLTEEEQYRTYYGRTLAESVSGNVADPGAGAGVGAGVGADTGTGALPDTRPQPPVITHAKTAGPGEDGTPVRPQASAGMFCSAGARAADDDTVDGFYDTLVGIGFGTENRETGMRNGAGGTSGAAAGKARDGIRERPRTGSGASAGGDASALAMRVLIAENGRLAASVADLRRELDAVHARSSERPHAHEEETVRVVLSVPSGRIKLGGKTWECNVVGSLQFGRAGKSAVLVVDDAAYASELLSVIENGPVRIVTAAGRTTCAYSGICDKIYGDAGSSDFITCFRFACEPPAGV